MLLRLLLLRRRQRGAGIGSGSVFSSSTASDVVADGVVSLLMNGVCVTSCGVVVRSKRRAGGVVAEVVARRRGQGIVAVDGAVGDGRRRIPVDHRRRRHRHRGRRRRRGGVAVV